MTTQAFIELYEQLRDATFACGVAGSRLCRRALGILSVNGVVGLIDHFEELCRSAAREPETGSVRARQILQGSVSGELVHILTDVALAATAAKEIIR